MKISDLIHALECMQREHGDLDVERLALTGDRIPARSPVIAYRAKLKGRESKPRFAEHYSHESDYETARKGAPVCRIA